MPFSSNPLMAPVFQSPVGDGQDHRPPVVSIKRAEDAVESGIRLHHNQAREGYILQPEVEGLGVAPVELQTAPLASGGSVARHSRLVEGDVFLPITLVSPVPSALPGMFDALVDIVRPGQRDEDGLPYQFEVVVFDPYGQETRSRRLIFESGLGDPVRVNHHVWRTSITGRFVDPYWYGTVRELRRVLGSVDKKFITAKQGPPDPEAPPSVTYEWEGEPHASPSVKRVDGEIVARNLVPNPSYEIEVGTADDYMSSLFKTDSSVALSALYGSRSRGLQVGPNASRFTPFGKQLTGITGGHWAAYKIPVFVNTTGPSGTKHLRLFRETRFGNDSWQGQGWTAVQSVSGGWVEFTGAIQVPEEHDQIRLMVYSYADESASSAPLEDWVFRTDGWHVSTASSEQAALDHVAEYFDGDTPNVPSRQIGGYEFPFFPVRIGGSVVQGEYELQVEGDAPAYWSGVITPPGEDLLIQNAQGERIFVQGRVDEPILIQTRPQEQDITLADGTPIWDRIDPGDDDFFPLHPGRNTVHVSMVGATQQSEILIRYREAFFHSLGGGQ